MKGLQETNTKVKGEKMKIVAYNIDKKKKKKIQ